VWLSCTLDSQTMPLMLPHCVLFFIVAVSEHTSCGPHIVCLHVHGSLTWLDLRQCWRPKCCVCISGRHLDRQYVATRL
jgi:hypothetical protein